MTKATLQHILEEPVAAVESNNGIEFDGKEHSLIGILKWPEAAQVYLAACVALKRPAMVENTQYVEYDLFCRVCKEKIDTIQTPMKYAHGMGEALCGGTAMQIHRRKSGCPGRLGWDNSPDRIIPKPTNPKET